MFIKSFFSTLLGRRPISHTIYFVPFLECLYSSNSFGKVRYLMMAKTCERESESKSKE
jgi:hypothetical protein